MLMNRIPIAVSRWLVSFCLLLAMASADEFPKLYDSEKDDGRRLAAAESAAKIALPDGFHATLFAAEPEVQNPIAMTIDPRGRVWIAENYTYSEGRLRFDLQLRDRLLIFEDTDGD